MPPQEFDFPCLGSTFLACFLLSFSHFLFHFRKFELEVASIVAFWVGHGSGHGSGRVGAHSWLNPSTGCSLLVCYSAVVC